MHYTYVLPLVLPGDRLSPSTPDRVSSRIYAQRSCSMKWLRWGGYALLALIALSIPTYWWLFVESHRARAASYAIDVAELRRLADSQAGA